MYNRLSQNTTLKCFPLCYLLTKRCLSRQCVLLKLPSKKHLARWRMESKSIRRNYLYRKSMSYQPLLSLIVKETRCRLKGCCRKVVRTIALFVRSCLRGLIVHHKRRHRRKGIVRKLPMKSKVNRHSKRSPGENQVDTPQPHSHASQKRPLDCSGDSKTVETHCEPSNGFTQRHQISRATAAFLDEEQQKIHVCTYKEEAQRRDHVCADTRSEKDTCKAPSGQPPGNPADTIQMQDNAFRHRLTELARRGIVKSVRINPTVLFGGKKKQNLDETTTTNTAHHMSAPWRHSLAFSGKMPDVINTFRAKPTRPDFPPRTKSHDLQAPHLKPESKKENTSGLLSNQTTFSLLKNIKVTSFDSLKKKA